jgi:hypothetical protein
MIGNLSDEPEMFEGARIGSGNNGPRTSIREEFQL